MNSSKNSHNESDSTRPTDLTGRDRMYSNVLYSWGGQIVFVITGFIMPRLIDQHVGQFSLGIWDFCWSIVSYLNLAGLGVGSSVNRYVAKHRANADVTGLRESVSSVMCIQLIVAVIVLLSMATIVWFLPFLFADRLGNEISVAQWVVGLLGSGIAVQMAFDTSRGVLSGCHRWDLHNSINAGSNAVSAALMILVLKSGGGLSSLGMVHLSVVILTETFRTFMAHRICPELQVRLSYVKWFKVKEMLLFGSKTIVASLPQFLIIQINNIIIVSVLGPAALAVLSRPVALVRHVETFINKFSFVLTPMASSIEAGGQREELRRFFFDTTRYGIALTLPIVIFLVIFGDLILYFWMGHKYAYGTVLAILAIGYFLPVSQNSVMRILMGINRHGRVGLINLIITLAVFIAGSLIINSIGWSILLVAILISVSLTAGNGLVVPFWACYRLNIPITDYLRNSFSVPVACSAVFAAWLVFIRLLIPGNPIIVTSCALSSGSILMAGLYFRFLIQKSFRTNIICKIENKLRPSWIYYGKK